MERRSFVRHSVAVPLVVLAGCLGGEPEDGEGDGEGDEPAEEDGVSLADAGFEVVRRSGGTRGDEVSVELDEGARTVTVEGTLTGRASCTTAELESAEYDSEGDVFEVDVRSFEDHDDDEMCNTVITEIEYRVVASFAGGLPARTVVSHDGEKVAEASFGT